MTRTDILVNNVQKVIIDLTDHVVKSTLHLAKFGNTSYGFSCLSIHVLFSILFCFS